MSVNIGQSHKSKRNVSLDFDRLKRIRELTQIPLALHGGSSINPDEINRVIEIGVRKFNLGLILKKIYFDTLKLELENIKDDFSYYKVVGSGLKEDIFMKARLKVQETVEKYMRLYGSAGKAS